MVEEVENGLKALNLSEYENIGLENIKKEDIGKKVRTFGWIECVRSQSSITFIDLVYHYKTVKCVYNKRMHLTTHTSLRVYATVSKNYGRDKHEFELQVDGVEVYNNVLAPSFPLNEESSTSSIRSNAHLFLRTKKRRLFLRARACLLKIIREFYILEGYTEITPPTIVQTQVEGGSTLFSVNYYDENAYLTQSSQLYLESVIPSACRAYCIMPSYRAEKSRTRRHLCEYTHVEAELADISFDELVLSIEKLIVYCMKRFYSEMGSEIVEIYPDFVFHKIPEGGLKRIKYYEAIEMLIDIGWKKEDGSIFKIGDDIPDAAERHLVDILGDGCGIFLMNFPVEHKPFYMRKDRDDETVTESVDFLFQNVGEILGGSIRKDSYEDLLEGFERENIPVEPYYWYLDMARYGPCPHGGYGLGFERLLMGLMKYESVDEAVLYPRTMSRCQP